MHAHTHTHKLAPYSCNLEDSAYAVCENGNMTAPANMTAPTIPGTAVLQELNVSIPFYGNILALLGFAIVARILTYLSLRFLRRK